MRRLLLFAVVAMLFAACTQDIVVDVTNPTIADNTPETLVVGFEDDETRIQLNEAQKTVWTKGDLVSVFYRSDANQKWHYQGETGERVAELTRVEAGVATEAMKRVVVVYPYSENYYINTETYNVQATLPAVQNYLKDSYGLDGNIMISSSEYNQFSLKNVCGWLKLQFTGDGEKVKSITLRGNNGEQVAGELYINSADATSILASDSGASDDDSEAGGSLISEDTILTEVTLDCSEGVELGAEATAFYIALPPQTFTKGITVDITAVDGSALTKSTDKELIILRNHIQPMKEFAYTPTTPANPKPANNEIWYNSGGTTYATTPHNVDAFGANIISNLYDAEKECWVITFDGNVTTIGDEAFYNCKNLRTIILPDSITSIEADAFHMCSNLTSVTIPSSVTKIGNNAFYRCDNLTNLYIDDLVWWCSNKFDSSPLSYADNLYLNGKLVTDVVIPKEVSVIRQGFGSCCIKSITIEDGVASIACRLSSSNSMTSVYIPKSVVYINNGAFEGCTGTLYTDSSYMDCNSVYNSYYGTTSNVGTYIGSKFTEVIFGSNVTIIPPKAFIDCATIERVSFGKDVALIGASAFSGCSNLKSADLPKNIQVIESDAFLGCNITTDLNLDKYVTLGSGALKGFMGKVYIGFDVPSSYLSGCGCAEVVLGDGVTSIGAYAFSNCEKMSKLTLSESVATIENRAFYGCRSLTSVTIPSNVTYIGDAVFMNCNALKTAYIKPTIPPYMGERVFSWFSGGSTYYDIETRIYVPASDDNSIIDAYKAATGWRSYKYYIYEAL